MKSKKSTNLFSLILLMATCLFITSCDKEDDIQDPHDTVSLNMLNEEHGKTVLGQSDVYITKANNFKSNAYYIADCGTSPGIGHKLGPSLNNIVREAAVIPGHLYQIFDKNALVEFPSGSRAARVGGAYYKVYTVSSIASDNLVTGALVKYVTEIPTDKYLPAWMDQIGDIRNYDDAIELALPKGSEYYIEATEYDIDPTKELYVSESNNKLTITLSAQAKEFNTHYKIYIRSGSIYTIAKFSVY